MMASPLSVVFLPPSHEQLPSYHVPAELLESFLTKLQSTTIVVWETPAPFEKPIDNETHPFFEVKIKPGTSPAVLQAFAEDFNGAAGV